MSRRTIAGIGGMLSVAVAGCTDISAPDKPQAPVVPTITRGQIVFSDTNAQFYAIFVADSSGVRLNRLSPSYSLDLDPAISSDGKRIAFSAGIPNEAWLDIYVMNADGTGRVRLTHEVNASSRQPAWSPDGKQIAFEHSVLTGEQIFVMNADGTDVRQLTNWTAGSTSPEWSSDGRKILFARDINGWENKGIFEMDADGSNVRQLTSGYRDAQPTRSPDGSRIAFIRETDSGASLFVMSADGSNVMWLANGIAWDANAAWSPDGKTVAFSVVSAARMCQDEYDSSWYACGREVKRTGLDGTIDPSWSLTSASELAWQR
jgi:Tol biopolymer transport system component